MGISNMDAAAKQLISQPKQYKRANLSSDKIGKGTEAPQQPSEGQVPEDTVVISAESIIMSESEREKHVPKTELERLLEKSENANNRLRTLQDELKRAQEVGEGMAKAMKIMLKCRQIAMRIMKGDNVPLKDERFLAENDIELYGKAIQMRIQKADPKDYDSILDDEDEETAAAENENASNIDLSSGNAAESVAADLPSTAEIME